MKCFGTPDPSLKYVNGFLLDPENGEMATIFQTSHIDSDGVAIEFQPLTGKTKRYTLPGSLGAWGGFIHKGVIYLGSHQTGAIFRKPLNADKFERLELPQDDGSQYRFVWNPEMASDGYIYFGSWPDGTLLRLNPDSLSIEKVAIPAPGEDYLRHVNTAFPGKIYCGIGAHAQLVEYDLASGKTRQLLPEQYRNRSFVYYTARYQNWLAALLRPDDVLLILDPETGDIIYELPVPDGESAYHTANHYNMLEHDGWLYFSTSPNDRLYRLRLPDKKLECISENSGNIIGLAANRYLFSRSSFNAYVIFDLETMQEKHRVPTNFEGPGMNTLRLVEGFDKKLYGGSYINQMLYRVDPKTEKMEQLGQSVAFGGQIRAIVPFNGKYYLGHYTHARLSVYDPKLPWQPGNGPTHNPRVIGAIGHEQDRIPTSYAGEDGRIYFGTIPEYGHLGGALVILNPEDESLQVFRNLIPDQSIHTLAGNGDGVLFGGTAVRGGLGMRVKATQAFLFGWDMAKQNLIFQRAMVKNATEMWALVVSPEGHVIGSADSSLFRYDPKTDKVLATLDTKFSTILRLILSQDGWIYGLSGTFLFRLKQDFSALKVLDTSAAPAYLGHGLVETTAGEIFFTKGHELFRLDEDDLA